MPIFFVKYSFTRNKIIYYKTAIVRACNSEAVKNKVVNFYRDKYGVVELFVFDKISVSSYNLVIT